MKVLIDSFHVTKKAHDFKKKIYRKRNCCLAVQSHYGRSNQGCSHLLPTIISSGGFQKEMYNKALSLAKLKIRGGKDHPVSGNILDAVPFPRASFIGTPVL